MRAYTLPSVRASIVSWMNVSIERPGGRHGAAHLELQIVLSDELVRAVLLDLEDVELRVQRVVRLRGPLEGPAEDPIRNRHLLDLAQDVAPRLEDAVIRRARELDRVHEDLRRAVRRRAERADRLAGVGLLPTGDERRVGRDAGDVRSEVRDVRARHLERRWVVRAVSAEHLRLLALLDELLRERLC